MLYRLAIRPCFYFGLLAISTTIDSSAFQPPLNVLLHFSFINIDYSAISRVVCYLPFMLAISLVNRFVCMLIFRVDGGLSWECAFFPMQFLTLFGFVVAVVFMLSYVLVSFDLFDWCRVFVNNRVTVVTVETKQCHAVNYECICKVCKVLLLFFRMLFCTYSPSIFHVSRLLVKLKSTQINTIRFVCAQIVVCQDILTKASKLCDIFQ